MCTDMCFDMRVDTCIDMWGNQHRAIVHHPVAFLVGRYVAHHLAEYVIDVADLKTHRHHRGRVSMAWDGDVLGLGGTVSTTEFQWCRHRPMSIRMIMHMSTHSHVYAHVCSHVYSHANVARITWRSASKSATSRTTESTMRSCGSSCVGSRLYSAVSRPISHRARITRR